MEAYNLMIQTNHCIINGEILTDEEKAKIVSNLLTRANVSEKSFHYFDEQPNTKARRPAFFLPPNNNGIKLKTIFGQIPKTHILNGNAYELEIIRLLYLFAPEDSMVDRMKIQTLNRLRATCFGYHGCSLGECFDSALVVLRFLIVASPKESTWIEKLITLYNEHYAEKKRVKGVEKYYELCISELSSDLALKYAV